MRSPWGRRLSGRVDLRITARDPRPLSRPWSLLCGSRFRRRIPARTPDHTLSHSGRLMLCPVVPPAGTLADRASLVWAYAAGMAPPGSHSPEGQAHGPRGRHGRISPVLDRKRTKPGSDRCGCTADALWACLRLFTPLLAQIRLEWNHPIPRKSMTFLVYFRTEQVRERRTCLSANPSVADDLERTSSPSPLDSDPPIQSKPDCLRAAVLEIGLPQEDFAPRSPPDFPIGPEIPALREGRPSPRQRPCNARMGHTMGTFLNGHFRVKGDKVRRRFTA